MCSAGTVFCSDSERVENALQCVSSRNDDSDVEHLEVE